MKCQGKTSCRNFISGDRVVLHSNPDQVGSLVSVQDNGKCRQHLRRMCFRIRMDNRKKRIIHLAAFGFVHVECPMAGVTPKRTKTAGHGGTHPHECERY